MDYSSNIMNEVKITYETLFDLLHREKAKEELQELDSTFYADVIFYLEGKFSLLKGSGVQSGLFGASESEKIKIQVVNIKKLLKELYERRLTKILKLAFNRSKTGEGLINTVSMLPEEKEFFEKALDLFIKDRSKVLNKILFLDENSKRSHNPAPTAEPKKEVATVLDSEKVGEKVNPAQEPDTNTTVVEDQVPKDDYDNRVKVRFKSSVPKFIGKKMELYGPYQEGDMAEVPELIAKILLSKDKAERL